MKRKCNVTNKEIVDSLKKSIIYNDDAIDYIKNKISSTENLLGYMPEDKNLREQLYTEKYIEHELLYVDKCYKDSLKRFGVNV